MKILILILMFLLLIPKIIDKTGGLKYLIVSYPALNAGFVFCISHSSPAELKLSK